MASFLITYKPYEENPKQGWPPNKLQNLIIRLNKNGTVQQRWRFKDTHSNRGDRVFLLIQGKLGPAIIGYGRVNGKQSLDSEGAPNYTN